MRCSHCTLGQLVEVQESSGRICYECSNRCWERMNPTMLAAAKVVYGDEVLRVREKAGYVDVALQIPHDSEAGKRLAAARYGILVHGNR